MLAKEDFPFLIVIADWEFVGDTRKWLQVLSDLANFTRGNHLVAIQVRIKNVNYREYQRLAGNAVEILGSDTRSVLNGEIEDARQFGYWGAHVSIDSNSDRVLNNQDLHFVSASVHCQNQLAAAQGLGVTAALCSPVFHPSWKDVDPIGLRGLETLTQASDIPTYALGGITPDQCEDCVKVGATGVAVLSAVLGAANPIEKVSEYLRFNPSASIGS